MDRATVLEQRVKIVATIGPASDKREIIREFIAAGMDVARLNFSHGDHDKHREVYGLIRDEAAKAGVAVGILGDLCGPKIRTGLLQGGAVELTDGASITVTTEQIEGTAQRVSTSYQELPEDVGPGDRILIDDGLLELAVESVQGQDIHCRVVVGGTLKNRKGMNIPGTPLSTPALTDKDRNDLAFAKELGVDYLALSFVRRPDDVRQAKELAGDIPIIAKIEKPEAVARLTEIIEVADGLMVARGDLGVEAGAEKVPLIQKRLIREAAERGLPVIVATQMLDSMMQNPRPTRAEVSDVANAVLDGTDAVMLSGETAAGEYPVESLRTMARVLHEVEKSDLFERMPVPVRVDEYSFSNATARAAVTAARDMGLKALVVYSESGHSANLAAACRPPCPIVGISRHDQVLQRLALRWGILPLRGEWVDGIFGVAEQAEQRLLDHGLAKPGDDIGITFGMRDMSGPGRTDMLKLWRVREPGNAGSSGWTD